MQHPRHALDDKGGCGLVIFPGAGSATVEVVPGEKVATGVDYEYGGGLCSVGEKLAEAGKGESSNAAGDGVRGTGRGLGGFVMSRSGGARRGAIGGAPMLLLTDSRFLFEGDLVLLLSRRGE